MKKLMEDNINVANNTTLKANQSKQLSTLVICGLSLALINCLSINPSFAADKNIISNMYLSDSGSLILETKDKKVINDFEVLTIDSKHHQIVLKNTDFDDELLAKLESNNFSVEKQETKKSYFSKDTNTIIKVDCNNACAPNFKALLGGLAHEFKLEQNIVQEPVAVEQKKSEPLKPAHKYDLATLNAQAAMDIQIEDQDFQPIEKPRMVVEAPQEPQKPLHLLQAKKKDSFVENFLDDLDKALVDKMLAQKDFQDQVQKRADAASLGYIADKLAQEGHTNLSADAYLKALEADPSNLNAALGLARSTKNKDLKLQFYLKALDDQALMHVGKAWFNKGLESGDIKQIAQGMVGFQFAILKSPANPFYRFQYAKALEQSGLENFPEASKRYLEAAVLAKKDYKAGDNSKEHILRESTECLIKLLTKSGDQEQAVHYCNSYIGLGFKKFMDGRSIKGVMKQISLSKNPFKA